MLQETYAFTRVSGSKAFKKVSTNEEKNLFLLNKPFPLVFFSPLQFINSWNIYVSPTWYSELLGQRVKEKILCSRKNLPPVGEGAMHTKDVDLWGRGYSVCPVSLSLSPQLLPFFPSFQPLRDCFLFAWLSRSVSNWGHLPQLSSPSIAALSKRVATSHRQLLSPPNGASLIEMCCGRYSLDFEDLVPKIFYVK